MRLVITAVTVLRIFAVTGIDHLIPNFPSLQEALAPAPAVPGSPPLPQPCPACPAFRRDCPPEPVSADRSVGPRALSGPGLGFLRWDLPGGGGELPGPGGIRQEEADERR